MHTLEANIKRSQSMKIWYKNHDKEDHPMWKEKVKVIC